jgi:type VI protein secretion system component VasK
MTYLKSLFEKLEVGFLNVVSLLMISVASIVVYGALAYWFESSGSILTHLIRIWLLLAVVQGVFLLLSIRHANRRRREARDLGGVPSHTEQKRDRCAG